MSRPGPRPSSPAHFREQWEAYPPLAARRGRRLYGRGRWSDRDGYIYVVAFGEWLKVGFSANPERRVNSIGAQLPAPVHVLYVVRASLSAEARLHAALARWRTNGEWFAAVPGCMETIRAALFPGPS